MWALINMDGGVQELHAIDPDGRYCPPEEMVPPMQCWVVVPEGWEAYVSNNFCWSPEGGWQEPEPGYILTRAKADVLPLINAATEAAILGGFEHEVGGVTYRFSYDRDDQANFAQANSAALLALTTGNEAYRINWRGWTGEAPHVLSLDTMAYLALARAAGDHQEACLAAGWGKQSAVQAAETLTDLEALSD